MQTLRKKNSPCKFKNAPTRFLGEGVSFKAKLIGILEVSEARGDRMCQAALADLKMAIRAAGEHKQRIAVQVSIDGLRLRDEKSGDCLYHHPVHKISFIAQDMSDSRAFGYIFGSPNTGHRFFGIKTDKAASQVVIAMRDLFQVVFELKKKEIELTKQQLEQNALNAIKFHSDFMPTRIFVEPTPDTKGAAGSEILDGRGNTNTELMKALKGTDKRNDSQSGVITDLLDLQFELNSLQQGIYHMDKINPENAPPSADDLLETDPFGDSFANMKLEDTVRPILPPPPSSKRGHLERQQTVPGVGAQSSVTSSPATTSTSKTPPLPSSIQWFDKDAENLFSDSELSSSAKNTPVKKEAEETQAKSPQIDVFTELDPLGTGLIKPYVDKKDFFQHLKNPPKKVLKDLVSTSSDTFQTNFDAFSESLDSGIARNEVTSKETQFDDGNFANFDKFDENEAVQAVFTRSDSSKRTDTSTRAAHHQPLSVSLPPEDAAPVASSVPLVTRIEKDSTESKQGPVKLPSPIKSTRKKELEIDLPKPLDKSFPVDFSTVNESPASPHKCCSPEIMCVCRSVAAEFDPVPERPPRGASSILINPPPLPPKKQGGRGALKPPPRPPHTDTYFHYDFPERETAKDRSKSPPKEVKSQFDDNFSPPVQLTNKSDLIGTMTTTASAFEDSFSSIMPTTNISTFFTSTSTPIGQKKPKPSLDITLSQLTSANLNELANSLGITVQELTSLTLQQLTECLAKLANKEVPPNDAEETDREQKIQGQAKTSSNDFQPFSTTKEQESKQDATYDKYAVFRELLELEQMERNEESTTKDSIEEETSSVSKEEFEMTAQQQESGDESRSEAVASLVNLTVNLPPSNEDLTKEESTEKPEETSVSSSIFEKTQLTESESKSELTEPTKPEAEVTTDAKKTIEVEVEPEKKVTEIEDKTEDTESTEKPTDSNEDSDKTIQETTSEETSAPSTVEKTPSVSMSSDRYAALREIIGEPEPTKQAEEESSSSRMSPIIQPPQTKPSVEVELLNLFADTPPASSPKKTKKEEETKSMGLDIFEEIERLSSSSHTTKKTKSLIPEDIFSSFTELKPDDGKDDGNWAKFDTGLFVTDRPGEDPHSISGTSPWSPDGKEFHKEGPFKGVYRQSGGDSDNESKDEEESEESNGRIRDGRFWCSRHSRFDVPFDERGFYEEGSSKRERSFRHRMMEKPRDATWMKNPDHRPRDPSPWHEESQWEQEPKRYPHRKMPYKDEEEQYEAHWKYRPKPQCWNWSHEHRPFYDDERKRKMMLWKEDRFGSQESMGYEDEDRMRSRRKYDRRRWEEDVRFWGRRSGGPPESNYPSRESYYYYREGRERPHDYPPPAWDEEYGSDRPADDSPRYNQPGRKRHWPKRPNSANEGRNVEMGYAESRKFGTSRSECSDNDSDPYPRSSQRSRSRESHWSSDQEYDSWVERPCWSEGPDPKSESLHQKRMPRKPRQPHAKTQSPFEDDFAQSVEHVDPSAVEPMAAEPRIRSEGSEQKSPHSPSFATRYPKGSRGTSRAMPAEEIYGKRSSCFEDDLTPSASGLSDTSDRQRLSWELKATPEELPSDSKEAHQPTDSFASEDNGRDSFFNGDLRYDDDDAFAFKSELEDNVSEHRATTLPLKNHARQGKYSTGSNNNNNNKSRSDQYIRKSESVNIFVRETDPFDDDDFFN